MDARSALSPWLFMAGLVTVVVGPAATGCFIYNEDLLEPGSSDDDGGNGGAGTAGMGGMVNTGGVVNPTTGGATTSMTTTGGQMTTGQMTTSSPSTGGSGGAPPVLWINELHYYNNGADSMEGVEIAGTAGANLNGYRVIFYNGSTPNAAVTYLTVDLSGTLPDEQNGLGTLWFDQGSIQNGDPDGLALVAPGDEVLEFLSYAGAMTAANGPAQGMASSDIGVTEGDTTPLGQSLQRTGTGSSGLQFTWTGPLLASPNSINDGQTFQ